MIIAVCFGNSEAIYRLGNFDLHFVGTTNDDLAVERSLEEFLGQRAESALTLSLIFEAANEIGVFTGDSLTLEVAFRVDIEHDRMAISQWLQREQYFANRCSVAADDFTFDLRASAKRSDLRAAAKQGECGDQSQEQYKELIHVLFQKNAQ